ncbi:MULTISPECIES: metal ABC transporter ATP-binding protein [Vibrio]|uniref:ATP-binding cassette domain-containing protein n=2 Tax=Vibrio TaxID=662 RepID=A0A7X4LNX2_9VIBR|nr:MULTISPECIES: ABC transporter ATP-binding protein [Vibrio]MBF9002252.1 ABC transporter ATP-binding protein [Vibrio nitrifigilis]MZI94966.1 ATP-binding cassette domain-containing protein [Vibrio eleionomae]
MIKLENVTVGYQGERLTHPISGSFAQGSLTAIMGANGAGKSTLLKTLCGLLPALSGQIEFSQPRKMALSWLPQQSDIDRSFPITVFDVVAMGCWPNTGILRSIKRNDVERIYAAMEQVGIANLANYTVSQLSGGQFQRMLFARLLVQDTAIMFMDEPFAGIDSQTQEALLSLICQLHQQGKTIVTVLHNPTIVEAYFPQTLLINQQCVHWGETKQVLASCSLYDSPMKMALNFG